LLVNFNENNAAVLVDVMVLLFETSVEKLVLGYYYRRRGAHTTSCTEPGAESRGGFEEAEGGGGRSDLRWKFVSSTGPLRKGGTLLS